MVGGVGLPSLAVGDQYLVADLGGKTNLITFLSYVFEINAQQSARSDKSKNRSTEGYSKLKSPETRQVQERLSPAGIIL